MNFLKRLKEYFAFTKNEQKVFLFLSVVFLSGVVVKAYKAYIAPPDVTQFDYSVSDSIFNERSRLLTNDSLISLKNDQHAIKVNLNTATKTELMTLPGIGEMTADRIIIYREEKGLFKKIGELKNVKGVGAKKFEKLKPHIEVK